MGSWRLWTTTPRSFLPSWLLLISMTENEDRPQFRSIFEELGIEFLPPVPGKRIVTYLPKVISRDERG